MSEEIQPSWNTAGNNDQRQTPRVSLSTSSSLSTRQNSIASAPEIRRASLQDIENNNILMQLLSQQQMTAAAAGAATNSSSQFGSSFVPSMNNNMGGMMTSLSNFLPQFVQFPQQGAGQMMYNQGGGGLNQGGGSINGQAPQGSMSSIEAGLQQQQRQLMDMFNNTRNAMPAAASSFDPSLHLQPFMNLNNSNAGNSNLGAGPTSEMALASEVIKQLSGGKRMDGMMNNVPMAAAAPGSGGSSSSSQNFPFGNSQMNALVTSSSDMNTSYVPAVSNHKPKGDDQGWEIQFKALRAYQLAEGNCKVPARCKTNPKLGRWVMTQRRQFTLLMQGLPSALTAERIRRLESTGFTWSVRPEPATNWNERFEELKGKIYPYVAFLPRSLPLILALTYLDHVL